MLAKICLLAAMLIPALTSAQDAEPARFFRLDFVVKEVEAGRTLNSRAYSALISTEKGFDSASIRTGSKVPIKAGDSSQFTYIEFGVNLDCTNPQVIDNRLALRVTADISSGLHETGTSPATPPTIRQNKWSSRVIVPLGKSSILFSSDDLTTKRQMQVELTAVPAR